MVKRMLQYVRKNFLLAIGIVLLVLTFYISYSRSVSFSFVDEFNNWVAGYYMIQGRMLYSEIFFNHQPLMPMVSAVIQYVAGPLTLYKIVTIHRLFIGMYLVFFGALTIWKLRYIGLGVVAFHTATMFYTFGNLFLAEALLVYPTAILFAGMWDSMAHNVPLKYHDYLLYGTCVLLFLLSREPYILPALIMYGMMMRNVWRTREGILSLGMIFFITVLILTLFPWKSYIFSLTSLNMTGIVSGEIKQNGNLWMSVVKSLFYPLYIIFSGKVTYVRLIQVTVVGIVFFVSTKLVAIQKYRQALVLSFFVLGLFAVRVVIPGTAFYEAYRQLPWYGAIFTFVLIGLREYKKNNRKTRIIFPILLLMFGVCYLNPQSFLYAKVQKEHEFTIHYLDYVQKGELIHALSQPTDTVFVHGWGSLTYLVAQQPPAYDYVFDYPVTDSILLFTSAKERMYTQFQPSFVDAGRCNPVKDAKALFPDDVWKQYGYVTQNNTNICLFVDKDVMSRGFSRETLQKMNYTYKEL